MKVQNLEFIQSLDDILDELRHQLHANKIHLLDMDPRPSGDSLQMQCIYHGNGCEHKPSAGIRRSDGKYHCFTCGEIHEFPEFVSNCFGYNDNGVFGWNWLIKNFMTISVGERKRVEFITNRRNIDNHGSNNNMDSTHYVSEEELESYRYIHPYLVNRGITDERLYDLFDIGYDSKTKCITFPIRDSSGHTLFIARRSVRTKYFNYPSSVEKSLYGLYELGLQQDYPSEVIVCESMIDALTCWQYGKYAVAMNGLGNKLCIQQLNELPCRKLILATDNDDAGRDARKRLRRLIKGKFIFEYAYDSYPEGCKDINDMTEEQFNNLEEVL
jgi:DNA primase